VLHEEGRRSLDNARGLAEAVARAPVPRNVEVLHAVVVPDDMRIGAATPKTCSGTRKGRIPRPVSDPRLLQTPEYGVAQQSRTDGAQSKIDCRGH